MIKLAFIITGLGRGGAEKMLLKLLRPMDKARFKARVFCLTSQNALQPAFEDAGIEVSTYRLNHPFWGMRDLWQLLKDCRQFAPDLIQGWMYHGNILAWLAAKVCKARLIFSIRAGLHDIKLERRKTQLIIHLGAKLSRSAHGIIYVSTLARQQHEAIGYSSRNSLTIANGFELDKFTPNTDLRQEYRERLGIKQSEVAIGFFARFHKLKGFNDLLDAFAIVHKKNPATKLVLAGDQVDERNRELNHKISGLRLQNHVLLLGQLICPERCFPALDLFVSPSLQEGFPNVVGEAMACGVPCIVTDVGDSALAVGDTGLVIQPGNNKALAEAILQFIANPDILPRHGKQARLRIETEFSLPAIVKQYEKAYISFVENT